MAAAHVQSVGAFTSAAATTRALAYGSNNAAGNLLVTMCVWFGATGQTATCTVADTANGAWTAIGTPATLDAFGLGIRTQMFYLENSASGANTVTMTTSASTSERLLSIFEFSGIATASSLDASAATTGTSAAPSVNLTGVDANALIVGGFWNGNTYTVGAGYTVGPAPDGNGTQYDLDAGAGGTVAFDCTQASSQPFSVRAAAFLPASDSWPPVDNPAAPPLRVARSSIRLA